MQYNIFQKHVKKNDLFNNEFKDNYESDESNNISYVMKTFMNQQNIDPHNMTNINKNINKNIKKKYKYNDNRSKDHRYKCKKVERKYKYKKIRGPKKFRLFSRSDISYIIQPNKLKKIFNDKENYFININRKIEKILKQKDSNKYEDINTLVNHKLQVNILNCRWIKKRLKSVDKLILYQKNRKNDLQINFSLINKLCHKISDFNAYLLVINLVKFTNNNEKYTLIEQNKLIKKLDDIYSFLKNKYQFDKIEQKDEYIYLHFRN